MSARRFWHVMVPALLVAGGVVGCANDPVEQAGPSTTDADPSTVERDGDGYRATITRTDGDVPHIVADDVKSLTFGQGWASSEDRACDLADQVMQINGERAKYLGAGEDNANITSDFVWRAIGIRELAGADWEVASDDVHDVITAYTDGWNARLAEVGAEGIEDWCKGADWVRPLEPVEVYAYARSIALQASSGALATYIASAQPPASSTTETSVPAGTGAAFDSVTIDAAPVVDPVIASNGWAIGADRSADGGGMLLANPHFPWEGQLRFWEVHLTIPGELDIYGANLSGVPGIAIGFTEQFAWTHTVSAGNRFTAYRLDLVPGDPTSYRYGDETRKMTSQDLTVDVKGTDGTMSTAERIVWRSHYGPIIDFPGVGWSETATITFRDANIDDDEFIDQYMSMMQADSLDELIDVHREVNGVPLFNTIAASADGRAWYGDTSATPNLSKEALARYDAAVAADPVVAIAAENGAVLLDGSDPGNEWVEVEGARDPGLVPYSEQPVVERDDYLFNANDSFWMPHATAMLEGDYSVLHGAQKTARSVRTRENATVLSDTSTSGPSGADGKFDLDELAAAALQNKGYTARALLDAVVERCRATPSVRVEVFVVDDAPQLPGGTIQLGPACDLLDGWDGVYDVDRRGPALFREFLSQFESIDFGAAGALWAEEFDPADPVATPSGLAKPPTSGADPVLVNLARATQVMRKAGVPIDSTLGELQQADRNGTLVPIHGGDSVDGTTNVVGFGRGWDTLDPTLVGLVRTRILPQTDLALIGGTGAPGVGYRINNGTSFLMAVDFTSDGPKAKSFLTYGNTSNRADPAYVEATERFSTKSWKDVAFTTEQVKAAALSDETVTG